MTIPVVLCELIITIADTKFKLQAHFKNNLSISAIPKTFLENLGSTGSVSWNVLDLWANIPWWRKQSSSHYHCSISRPSRYDINKAWHNHRKQQMMDQDRRYELEAYTSPPVVVTEGVEIIPNGKWQRQNMIRPTGQIWNNKVGRRISYSAVWQIHNDMSLAQ